MTLIDSATQRPRWRRPAARLCSRRPLQQVFARSSAFALAGAAVALLSLSSQLLDVEMDSDLATLTWNSGLESGDDRTLNSMLGVAVGVHAVQQHYCSGDGSAYTNCCPLDEVVDNSRCDFHTGCELSGEQTIVERTIDEGMTSISEFEFDWDADSLRVIDTRRFGMTRDFVGNKTIELRLKVQD